MPDQLPSFLGYGVFETLAVVAGRPLLVDEHWAALRRSAAALRLPVRTDPRRWAARLPRGAEGRWRWIVDAAGARATFGRETVPRAPRRAFRLARCQIRVGSANWDARHKTLSYLAHAQARAEVLAGGAQEAVLANERDEPVSGAMSNLFWVSGGRLLTPAAERGCREGAVRSWVLAQGLPCRLVMRPRWQHLRDADEVFVTNSLLGIQPVSAFEEREWPRPGPACRMLARLYREKVLTSPAGR